MFMTLVSAGLFLYVGFGLGLVGISGNRIYDGSVTALTWGARIVGFGILGVALLSYLRVPGAVALDFVLGLLATVLCGVVGAVWLVFRDWQGVLLLLFALLNASATKNAWQRWRGPRTARGAGFSGEPPGGDAT